MTINFGDVVTVELASEVKFGRHHPVSRNLAYVCGPVRVMSAVFAISATSPVYL
jgi:hypothetical protein